MTSLDALGLMAALVAVCAVAGLFWRSRQGRITVISASLAEQPLTPADVASEQAFGTEATLVQFSTEFCARCPATSVLLGSVAVARPGVVHIDVDVTHRRDLAARFSIMQTPTTLILDSTGKVRARVGGAPSRSGIDHHLDNLTGSSHERLNH
jgi:thiol-disulfide isomerase/thioredoxin